MFTDPAKREGLRRGPVARHLDGFASWLWREGYARHTIRQKVHVVAELSHWLHRRRLRVTELDEQKLAKFVKHKRRHGRINRGDAATLHQLLDYLRLEQGIAVPVAVSDDPQLDRIEADFKLYLTEERGLSQATLLNYVPMVRRLLCECFRTRPIRLDRLRAEDVTGFILRHSSSVAPKGAKVMVSALRCFFRFLRMRGDIVTDLAAAVPTVAYWRLSSLPQSLPAPQVERVLDCCDQSSPGGQRNYAILLLLARLGLRAGEVVHMSLDDIDWQAGELTVRGKGGREERLPIPQDVGEALVEYLCHGRPPSPTRRVFIRMRAPRRGFANSVAICTIVSRALARAGLDPPHKGAHLLRHSLATEMLRQGASLNEIGEILRHQQLTTTQIYAKVDVTALRTLAPPWPGVTI